MKTIIILSAIIIAIVALSITIIKIILDKNKRQVGLLNEENRRLGQQYEKLHRDYDDKIENIKKYKTMITTLEKIKDKYDDKKEEILSGTNAFDTDLSRVRNDKD